MCENPSFFETDAAHVLLGIVSAVWGDQPATNQKFEIFWW
jgi:hypothetical protein